MSTSVFFKAHPRNAIVLNPKSWHSVPPTRHVVTSFAVHVFLKLVVNMSSEGTHGRHARTQSTQGKEWIWTQNPSGQDDACVRHLWTGHRTRNNTPVKVQLKSIRMSLHLPQECCKVPLSNKTLGHESCSTILKQRR